MPSDELDCPMCGAAKSFTIDPIDGSVGYCAKEQQRWRITAKSLCATKGCIRPAATFGDYCMTCLEDRVNAEVIQ